MNRYGIYIILLAAIGGILLLAKQSKTPDRSPGNVSPDSTSSSTVVATVTPSPSPTASPGLNLVFDFNVNPNPEVKNYRLEEGDTVSIFASAPFDDEIHIHGYDLHLELKENQPNSLQFNATKTGRFEMELEAKHQPVAILEVYPR